MDLILCNFSKYIISAYFFIFPQYCQTIIMCKGVGNFYKHIQHNWTYPFPNTTAVVPPRSELLLQHDITNDCSATIFEHNQLSPVSNLTTTNHVDTDINNDDGTQSFENPIKI